MAENVNAHISKKQMGTIVAAILAASGHSTVKVREKFKELLKVVGDDIEKTNDDMKKTHKASASGSIQELTDKPKPKSFAEQQQARKQEEQGY